jgi:hypothetical protein
MEHSHAHAAQLTLEHLRQRPAPHIAVIVTADRVDGRDRREPIDHLATTDVSGMKNPLNPAQRG